MELGSFMGHELSVGEHIIFILMMILFPNIAAQYGLQKILKLELLTKECDQLRNAHMLNEICEQFKDAKSSNLNSTLSTIYRGCCPDAICGDLCYSELSPQQWDTWYGAGNEIAIMLVMSVLGFCVFIIWASK